MIFSMRYGLALALLSSVGICGAEKDLRNLRTSLNPQYKERNSLHSNKDGGGEGGLSISAEVVPIAEEINPNEVVVIVEDSSSTEVVPPADESGGSTEVVPPVDESDGSTEVVPPVDETGGSTEVVPPVDESDGSTEAIPPVDESGGSIEVVPPVDESALFIESEICGPELVGCALEGPCFDHTRGVCLEDGNITQADCLGAHLWCKPCFSNSRCGSLNATTFDVSGLSVESDICGPELANCVLEGPCFDHTMGVCQENGTIALPACEEASFFCKTCFPNSRCGSTEAPSVDESGLFVESDICGPELATCALDILCFDHTMGVCLEDGNNSTLADCEGANLWCKPCFPNSRCGSTEPPPVDDSSLFIESDICGPELADCYLEGPCFDHSMGVCQLDGTIALADCQGADLWCKPCFPNSRCGATETPTLDQSGLLIESALCGYDLADCAIDGPCFDHTMGVCLEDGNMNLADCDEADFWCKPCFPNSRCGSGDGLSFGKRERHLRS
jgi:hypothetical protein